MREQMVLHLGIQKIGAISVILNPGFKKEEMSYFLNDTDARIVAVGKNEEALIRSIDEKRRVISIDTGTPFDEKKLFPSSPVDLVQGARSPDDPAILIYTSGTTGQPKGAILTRGI